MITGALVFYFLGQPSGIDAGVGNELNEVPLEYIGIKHLLIQFIGQICNCSLHLIQTETFQVDLYRLILLVPCIQGLHRVLDAPLLALNADAVVLI